MYGKRMETEETERTENGFSVIFRFNPFGQQRGFAADRGTENGWERMETEICSCRPGDDRVNI